MPVADDIRLGGEEQSGPPPAFVPGSVARLKTGGPKMTVDSLLRTDGIVSTLWFDGATLHRDAFDPVCLVQAGD